MSKENPTGSKRLLNLLLSMGLSAVAITVLALTTNLERMAEEMRRSEMGWFALVAVIMSLSYVVRAWRWSDLLNYQPMPGFGDRWKAVNMGFFANSILPLRMGEFLRPLVLERLSEVPYSTGLASILTERIADGYILMAYLGVIAILSQQNTLEVLGLGTAAIILTIIGTILIILMARNGRRTARRIRICIHRFSPRMAVKIEHALIRFAESLTFWSSPARISRIAGKTALVWLVIAVTTIPAAIGMGIWDKMPYWGPLMVMALTVMGVSIPSAPANIGIFELSAAGGLIIAIPGTSWDLAVGFGILLHAAQLVPVCAVGLYLLLRGEVSLFRDRSRRTSHQGGPSD